MKSDKLLILAILESWLLSGVISQKSKQYLLEHVDRDAVINGEYCVGWSL